MGYVDSNSNPFDFASSYVAPTVALLDTLQQQLGQLSAAFESDAQYQVTLANDLADYFAGTGASAFVQAVHNYGSLTTTLLQNPLTDLQTAARTLRDALQNSAANLDGTLYEGYDQVAEMAFSSLNPDDIFGSGRDAMSAAINQAVTFYEQQMKHEPSPGPYPEASTAQPMVDWATFVFDSTRTWQTTVADHTFAENTVPTLQGITPNLAEINSIEGDLNQEDIGGNINSSPPDQFKNTITPAEYQQVVGTFKDPRTQELLFLLMSTPTGKQFATYLLYMGKKLGGDNFISWHHLGSNVGGVSTNGFIQLNIDDFENNGPVESARVVVHEAVETYYDVGPGIRQMGQQHADYVAEWYGGKFLYELPSNLNPGYDPCGTAYGKSFSAWAKSQDGQGYKHEGVTIDPNSHDSPGWAWSSNDPSWWAWFTRQEKYVGTPPNPMGLTPQMLTVDDMNKLDPVPAGYSCP